MPLDPAGYLTSKGWKGKGTALRDGHSTRPLPTVVKRSMTGVGKDRDEAIPFWDTIFASAAMSIKLATPSATPTASPSISAPASGTTTPVLAANDKQTVPDADPKSPPAGIPSSAESSSRTSAMSPYIQARREVARRRLYSGFNRGAVLVNDHPMEDLVVTQPSRTGNTNVAQKAASTSSGIDIAPIASTSSLTQSSTPSTSVLPSVTTSSKQIVKAEKAARKADRAQKRADKEARRLRKEARSAVLDGIARAKAGDNSAETILHTDEKGKGKEEGQGQGVGHEGRAESVTKKKKERKGQDLHGENAAELKATISVNSPKVEGGKGELGKKEKKRKGTSVDPVPIGTSPPAAIATGNPNGKKRKRDKGDSVSPSTETDNKASSSSMTLLAEQINGPLSADNVEQEMKGVNADMDRAKSEKRMEAGSGGEAGPEKKRKKRSKGV